MRDFSFKKVLWASFLLLVISTVASAKVTVEKTGNQIKYRFEIEDVRYSKVTLEKMEFVQVDLKGVDGYLGVYHKVGSPEVPVLRFYIDGNERIHSVSHDLMLPDLPPGEKIAPHQDSVFKIRGVKRKFAFSNSAYHRDSFWPEGVYSTDEAGSIRGVPRTLVTIFPFKYNAVTGGRMLLDVVELTIDVKPAPEVNNAPKLIAFVVGKDFAASPSLKKYVDFKKSQGFATKTIVFGDEVNDPAGIRAALKKLLADHSQNLSYAIIVGDSDFVPGYSSSSTVEDDGESTEESYITDHYYRAIDTDNYKTDLNGPDIGVGRISVRSEKQLSDVVDKYIRYQKGQFTDKKWLEKAAFLGSSDEDYFQVAEGTHNYVIDSYTSKLGYYGYFPLSAAVNGKVKGGDKLYPKTMSATLEDMKKAAEDGRSLFIYSGHGGEDGWEDFVDNDVLALTNKDYMPMVTSFACSTAHYTAETVYAEVWQRHPAGAIMFWGSYSPSLWDEDDIIERRLMDAIFVNKYLEFGAMTNFSLSELWKHYGGGGYSKYYWENYTTFADPTVNLRVLK